MKLYHTSHHNSHTTMNCTKKAASSATLLALIIALTLTGNLAYAEAQAPTHFSSADKFAIPAQNSTITFALNGSYTSAALESGTWVFRNLSFDDPRIPYFDLSGFLSLGDLNISAQDCNVTIWIYLNANFSFPILLLSYFVEGNGVQTVNLGLNSTGPADSSEWGVVIADDQFLAEGKGYTLQPDNTLIIQPPPGNVTVMHYDFNDPQFNESLPFWLKHSVALLTVAVAATVVAVAVIIGVRKRKATAKQV